jgi:hypothetical protein
MKKCILWFFGVVLTLVLVLAAVPYFFKDQIKAKLLNEIDKRIDADFYFGDMSISSFKHFPHMTMDLHNFYILGKEKFKGDTLGDAKVLSVSFDFYSVINSTRKIEVKSIHLKEPHVHILVLPDGESNYAIFNSHSRSRESSSFNVNIDRWEIEEGEIIYNDQQQHTYLELNGVNHSGNGDFTQNISDLNIATSVEKVSYSLNGIKYLDRKKLTTDLKMEMNLKELKFTFKDHVFEINHFKFGFEGYFKFLKEGYEVDLRLLVNRTDFRDLLSMMPGFYLEDFKKMKVTGEFTLEGHAKGVYDFASNRIPTFSLDLDVKDGAFKYNRLPKAVDHINLDLLLENTTGVSTETSLDVRNFHVEMDHAPIQGHLKMTGVSKGFIDSEIKATVDLAKIEKMYPIDGIVLRGLLSADIKAKGTFNRALNRFPIVDAQLTLDRGYIKSKDFPEAMEKIHIDAEAVNTTGNLTDTRIDIHRLDYVLDGEPFEMKGSISNLANYAYDLTIDGLIDLKKLTQLYPVPGMSISGTLDVDVEISGKLSTLQAKHFDSLKSSGTIEIKNVVLAYKDLSKTIKISDAKMKFTPQEIELEKFTGEVGKSDFSITGHLFDYHSYIFETGRNVKGDLELASDTLDLNDLMASSSTPPKDSSQSGIKVIVLPRGIDFTFDAKIGFIRFDQMQIEDLAGEVKIKDGLLTLNETGFTSQDAKFSINGEYDTRDPKHPLFDMLLDINKLDINKAYSMFETVQSAAPAAQTTDGIFSTKYHLKGELNPDFSPAMATLTGGGTIIVEDAEIKGMKVFNHVSNITNKKELNDPKVKTMTLETEIKGGKVYIKPVAFQIGKYLTELEGSQGFDNTIDYVLKLSVPSLHKIKVPFHISGTVNKPVVKLGKGHEHFDFKTF